MARWGALPLVAWPLGSWALGLGEIETNSYLNQPLDAEIPLSATPEELANLSVSLAPVSAFSAQGIEYQAVLSSIELEVGQNAAGENVIRVTSTRSITEPFVTMLIEVSSGRTTFFREQSVLLDPPLFLSEEAPAEPIAAPATRDPEPGVAGGAIERQSAPQPAPPPASVPESAPQQPAPVAGGGDYTVQTGDTLWDIAERSRPAGVSMNQAMIAIYEANPAAFGDNINLLRRGAILRIPPASALGSVTAAAATAEVRRQIEVWEGGAAEPRLVLIPPGEDGEAAAVSGAVTAAGADDSAAVAALEDEVADLQSELDATRAELAETERLLELRDAELANVQALGETGAEAAAAAEIDAGVEAELEAELEAEAEAEAEAPVFVDEAAGDEETAVGDEETAAESTQPAPAAAGSESGSPSLVDRIVDTVTRPVVLVGGGIALLLIAALALLRRRRHDDIEDVTGQWEALEAELDEEGDNAATARIRARASEPDMVVVESRGGDAPAGTEAPGDDAAGDDAFDSGTARLEALTEPAGALGAGNVADEGAASADPTLSGQAVINLDQADPIAEADFHMAYGLYDQAADLIGKALESDPGNRAYQIKLLEVYFVWGNKEAFLERATALRNEIGSGPDWDKVVIMGKQICPDEPLFSGAQAAAGEVDLDLESSGSIAGLDFAFGEAGDDGAELDLDVADGGGLSLEPSGAHETRVESDPGDEDILELGARTQAGLEAALFAETDAEGEKTSPGGELGDLDSTMESPTVETEAAGSGDDFGGMTLEGPTVEAEGPDAPTVETPTIETSGPGNTWGGDTAEQPRPAASSGDTAEIELDDLGLDVSSLPAGLDVLSGADDSPTGVNAAAADDETGRHESATDADLLSATGVTQVLDEDDDNDNKSGHTGTTVIDDEDATMLAPGLDAGTSTEVLEHKGGQFEPAGPATEDDLDLNLGDFSSALEGADTIEQPAPSGFQSMDFDVGSDDVKADDEPTGTEAVGPLDPQTMTEVGTKLDLARAYIDMGDPEGAKSILEEVLNEGDTGQRSEAQALIDALPA